jgi:Rod binding domain-containing protein
MESTIGNNFISSMGSVARSNLASAETERLKTQINLSTDEAKRKQALQDFEAMFISQMYKIMLNSVPVDENFGGGYAEETFRDFLTEEYGKITSQAGGFGIAEKLQQSLFDFKNINTEAQNTVADADRAAKAYSRL